MAKKTAPLPKVGQQVWVQYGLLRRRYPFTVIEPGCVEKGIEPQVGVHLRPLRGGRAKWEVLENVWNTD